MTTQEIVQKLESAGCRVRVWEGRETRVYVHSTPCGGKDDFGYCVAADDVSDVVRNISRRRGEIGQILCGER